MACFSAKKIAGSVLAIIDVGETFVLASPFALLFVVIAQTQPLVLFCVVREGQTDSQWQVQFSDEPALSI